MWDILDKLYTVAKSYMGRKDQTSEDRERIFEKKYHDPQESSFRNTWQDNKFRSSSAPPGYDQNDYTDSDTGKNYPGGQSQLAEDHAVFGLKSPSSLKEVKHARNRELKKHHSDLHVDDAEKFKASNEIMRIYNAAYERLSKYYDH